VSSVGGVYTLGVCSDIQVAGDLAYIADGAYGLGIYSVSNPASIAALGYSETDGYAYGVEVHGTRAYVADGYRGVKIYDVAQPTNAVLLGSYASREAWNVRVMGSLAFVANGPDGLLVLDVSDPANMLQVASFATGGYVRDVKIVGSRIYLADGSWGLTILDAPPVFDAPISTPQLLQVSVLNLLEQGSLVIESSTNAMKWDPIQTNAVAGREASVSVAISPNTLRQLFRALVRPK